VCEPGLFELVIFNSVQIVWDFRMSLCLLRKNRGVYIEKKPKELLRESRQEGIMWRSRTGVKHFTKPENDRNQRVATFIKSMV